MTNFYYHTSLQCLKKSFDKVWDMKKKSENKTSVILPLIQDWDDKG